MRAFITSELGTKAEVRLTTPCGSVNLSSRLLSISRSTAEKAKHADGGNRAFIPSKLSPSASHFCCY